MHCYLKPRKGNGIYYIWEYDASTGQCRKFSTGTRDCIAAEKKLAEHIIRLPQRQVMNDATLVHILLRYWEHHGQAVFSTNTIRRVMGLIVEHEPSTRLYDWPIQRQKEFAAKIGAKPGTQRRYMGVIRAAVQRSFDNGEIPSIPAILKVSAEDGEGVRAYEVTELRALMAAATYDHERRFLLLCIATAARPSAVLQLTWDRVSGSVVDLNVPGRRRTKKRRALAPLAPIAAAYLEAHRSVGPVVQWRGRAMAAYKMTFHRLAKRAGVAATAYGIRKAVSIWLRMSGVPEMDIKGLLGHSVGNITERYAHYRPEYMRAAADAVECLLRDICPPWLASYLPAAPVENLQVLEVTGGSYRTRTYDQFLKRDGIEQLFQELKASNDD